MISRVPLRLTTFHSTIDGVVDVATWYS